MTGSGTTAHKADLPELERTVLWCIRAWIISLSNHPDHADRIRAIFERLGSDGLALQQWEAHQEAFDILTHLMTDVAALEACDHLARPTLAFSAAATGSRTIGMVPIAAPFGSKIRKLEVLQSGFECKLMCAYAVRQRAIDIKNNNVSFSRRNNPRL
ncbi:hypothetical protein [Nguyenibacter vanlangensis]|uniref:Uncharacterized protein n=1 Tax=Nguyenibacter vanlangensis TaxID=1216886 RepID=A0A7Y7M729_9PROT|nr:hypothetical protein [Nguyenibacter vanlangensis]NVN11396.1 hypothetical protein [Nguyenibacter vanlangensis]